MLWPFYTARRLGKSTACYDNTSVVAIRPLLRETAHAPISVRPGRLKGGVVQVFSLVIYDAVWSAIHFLNLLNPLPDCLNNCPSCPQIWAPGLGYICSMQLHGRSP